MIAAADQAGGELEQREADGTGERQQRRPGDGTGARPDDHQDAGEADEHAQPVVQRGAFAQERAGQGHDHERRGEGQRRDLGQRQQGQPGHHGEAREPSASGRATPAAPGEATRNSTGQTARGVVARITGTAKA